MIFRPVALLYLVPLIAAATTFKIPPANIGNGYVISGTIETDGTLGYLAPQNFTKWNLALTQTTDTIFTEQNTTAANIHNVTSDGKMLRVPASPDGFTDGGYLVFLGPAHGGIPSGPLVADFTGPNVAGGVSGWQTPLALNYAYLNQPNGTIYNAAVIAKGRQTVFNIAPVTIYPTPTVVTMFGTITTDGTVGALTPQNIKSWRIVGREQDIQHYNEANSQILASLQVYSDNTVLKVMNPSGNLQIGVPPTVRLPGITVTLADFTDISYPNGVASYYYSIFGLVAARSPLTRNSFIIVGKL